MSAIQGIEGVISQLQATAMSARAQDSLPQPTISFAGQLHAVLDRLERGRQARSIAFVERFVDQRADRRKIHSR